MSPPAGGSGPRRPPERVPVLYFPKRPRAPHSPQSTGRTVTLTMPEIQALPSELTELVTEPSLSFDRRSLPEESTPDPRRGRALEPARRKGPGARKGKARRGGRRSDETTQRVVDPRVEMKTDPGTLKTEPGLGPGPGRSPEELLDMCLEGHGLFEKGRLQEARRIFEELVALQLPDPFPHTMLGTVYLALGAHDRALALFEAALLIDPDDLAARVYRGEIQLNRGRTRLAEADLERALQLASPEDPFVQRARRLLRIAAQVPEARKRSG